MENIVYLPLVLNNYIPATYKPNKGIALVTNILSDLWEVGAGWYYTWSCSAEHLKDNRYVPMAYSGLVPDNLPEDYDGFVLFLNEPNNPAPFGANITPQLAAERYSKFMLERPLAKLVVGNISAWASMWIIEFIWALDASYPDTPKPKYYGLHGYVESWITVEQLVKWWDSIERFIYQYSGIQPEIWITEFADTLGNTEKLLDLLNIIENKKYITRYAYFTNRYDPEAEYIPIGWYDFGLFENDKLSPIGEVYKYF